MVVLEIYSPLNELLNLVLFSLGGTEENLMISGELREIGKETQDAFPHILTSFNSHHLRSSRIKCFIPLEIKSFLFHKLEL